MLPTIDECKQIISQNAINVARELLAKENINFHFIETQDEFEEIILGKCRELSDFNDNIPYLTNLIRIACVFQALNVLTEEQIYINCKFLCEIGDILFYDEGRPDLALRSFQLACGFSPVYEDALWGVMTVCLQSSVSTEIALPYAIVMASVNPEKDEVNYVVRRIREENPSFFQTTPDHSDQNKKSEWPTAGGDERRTGYLPSTLKAPLQLKWVFDDSANIFSGIVAANNMVIFGDVEGKIFALDFETGKKIWDKQLTGKHFGTPTIEKDMVVCGISNKAYCFDLNRGNLIWHFEEAASESDDISNYSFASYGCPLMVSGKAIFCDDRLAIFSIQTGILLFKERGSISSPTTGACFSNDTIYFPRRKSILKFPLYLKQLEELPVYLNGKITAGPVVGDSKLLVGTSASTVDCIDLRKERISWSFHIEEPARSSLGYLESTPAVYQKNVIFGAPDGNVYNVDLNSGQKIWKTNLDSEVERPVVISNEQVFVLSSDCTLHALDVNSGQIKWQKRLLEKKGAKGFLAIYNDHLLVGLDRLYCFGNE